MKRLLPWSLMLFSVLLFSRSFGQILPECQAFDWQSDPKPATLTEKQKLLPELLVKESHWLEYIYDSDKLVYYRLVHKIFCVNSPEAIDRHNKIYLPMSEGLEVVRQKARVIRPDGKCIELKKEAIRQGVDEESNTPYRYFAIEGLTQGSTIEYFYETKEEADYYGTRYMLQDELLKLDVDFRLISPRNLVFAFKCLNGIPPLTGDTLPNGKNIRQIHLDSLSGIKEEEFALYTSNLGQVVFKLDVNHYTGKKNIINYISAAQSIFNLTHEEANKKVTKKLQKIIDEAGVSDNDDLFTKVRKIESYIKTNYREIKGAPDGLEDILKNKASRTSGIVKLYVMIYAQMGIDCEVILSSNRYESRFDPKFESYNYLHTYLLYFPGLDTYLAPEAPSYRLGIIPYAYINNYGLFVKTIKVGEVTTGIGEVKFIPPNDGKKTAHNMFVKVDMTNSVDNPKVDANIEFTGYYATPFQPYYDFLTEDRQKEMLDDLLKNTYKTGQFSNTVVENKGTAWLNIKPYVVKSTVTIPGLVERAGSKYLFKIGDLIGPQTELYQENTRVFDIENDFNRTYYREIEFTIPSGYKVSNLDALKFDIKLRLAENIQPQTAFISDYKETGPNSWKITVNEYYMKLEYSKANYEDYRKVVNAAADFNKIVLLLEKQ